MSIDISGVSKRFGDFVALDDVTVSLPTGQLTALLGPSGSGKTSFTRLLQGLYLPQSGLIRFDGHDIREIDLAHLRRSIGVVVQESFLFRGSVRDNIAISKPGASFADNSTTAYPSAR